MGQQSLNCIIYWLRNARLSLFWQWSLSKFELFSHYLSNITEKIQLCCEWCAVCTVCAVTNECYSVHSCACVYVNFLISSFHGQPNNCILCWEKKFHMCEFPLNALHVALPLTLAHGLFICTSKHEEAWKRHSSKNKKTKMKIRSSPTHAIAKKHPHSIDGVTCDCALNAIFSHIVFRLAFFSRLIR